MSKFVSIIKILPQMLIEPQNISFTTSAVLFQSGSEKVAASSQNVPKMSHSVPLQSKTTGFPWIKNFCLSLSCHKLALYSANWQQWSLNTEGTVAQRFCSKRPTYFYKNNEKREYSSIQKYVKVNAAGVLFTEKFCFIYSRQPCIDHFLSCFICMYACMYFFINLLISVRFDERYGFPVSSGHKIHTFERKSSSIYNTWTKGLLLRKTLY